MHPDYSPAASFRPPATRQRVEALERALQKLPQVDCAVWHHFAPGLYARRMLIPADTVLTGAVHKTEHLVIVSGDISVTTPEGTKRISGTHEIFTSLPGEKRAGYAHADTYFTTVHATDETDLDRLVEELTESTSDELLGGAKNMQLMNQKALEGQS
ncbi:hypothetical protein [Burkholderia cepacia]|uniref:hypothetical protein n=1 Tax=Burkholderia cepacia TaxID=292 RepID=UPI00398E7FA4